MTAHARPQAPGRLQDAAQAPRTAWHAGEQALQQRAGVAARMAEVGARALRDHMPEQHREFFAQLPFLLVGTVDDAGQPQASLLAGPPGFVHSPDPRQLRVDAQPLPGDPGFAVLRAGAAIGLLGIQPHTRRRNRLNGWVTEMDARGFNVSVGQSFGNCPKYITPREAEYAAPGTAQARVAAGWDADARRIVEAADTFFIATAHPEAASSRDPARGIDISHRGGPAGFVRADAGGTLLVPDYVGNAFFNTFGNLLLEPRCGLLFLDYATGERLQLTARAELQWEGDALATFPGALRLLRVQVTQARRLTGGLPLRWRPPPALAQL